MGGKQTTKKKVGRPKKSEVPEAKEVEQEPDEPTVKEPLTVEVPEQPKEDVSDTDVGDMTADNAVWTDEQMKSAVEIAFLKGKLSIYEEAYTLERRGA